MIRSTPLCLMYCPPEAAHGRCARRLCAMANWCAAVSRRLLSGRCKA